MHALITRLNSATGLLPLLGMALAAAPGLVLQNPAVGLIGGAAYILITTTNPIERSTHYGKLSLQTAIVLLGLTMNLEALIELSTTYAGIVALYVLSTLAIGLTLCRVLGIDRITGTLLTIGTAICGGTAIAAAAPLLKADPGRIGVALGAVFLLNLVALLTFPYLVGALDLSQETFGAFVALAIHDTSSVVATAAIVGQDAAETAATIKLGRTLWLVPVVIALGIFARGDSGTEAVRRASIPAFVVLFVLAAALATWLPIPQIVTSAAAGVSKTLLVVALFLIGLELNRETLGRLKGRDGLFALGLWVVMAPLALFGVLWIAS